MRGTTMRLFTVEQHKSILEECSNNYEAARKYTALSGKVINESTVRYWRTIFQEHSGNMAKADRKLKEERVIRKASPDDDIGTLDFIPNKARSILVIPDLHAPYHHLDALAFLKNIREDFHPDLVVCLGDELDYHALSFHDSDPNLDSAGTELEKGREFLLELHEEFPEMLICHSNHGSMAYRRAKAHGIPAQLIRSYREVIFRGGGNRWSWAEHWKVNTPLGPILFKHQSSNILTDAAHNSCNLIVGHNHGQFSVEYSASSAHLYFGAYSGCLVDKDSMAFAYGKHSLRKPVLGCTVVLNGRPVCIPMVLRADSRWVGRL